MDYSIDDSVANDGRESPDGPDGGEHWQEREPSVLRQLLDADSRPDGPPSYDDGPISERHMNDEHRLQPALLQDQYQDAGTYFAAAGDGYRYSSADQ